MVPNPSRIEAITSGNSIVISGVAGKFPRSNNVAEFSRNLYDKVDLVDDLETRWRHINPEIPRRTGKLNYLNKFDSQFFGIPTTEAHSLDPQMRMLLEHSFEAIMDAGLNPNTLRGSRTGVFVGICFSETEKEFIYTDIAPKGYGVKGSIRSMIANRLSYELDLQGPSMTVDTACSSSMYALDCAFKAVRDGRCDSALVAGTNLLLHPYVTLQFARLGVLSADGYCRPFDISATGYSRAEANAVIFLQRAKDAKRVYAHVMHSKTNCDGFKQEGITYPSGQMQKQLLNEFYDEVGILPQNVNYVEAHSTGTVVGDPEECDAIEKVFCRDRIAPLPVGSVKSNIGHSEAAAGICSITKCIIASESGVIPPNINFKQNRIDVPSLTTNKLQVITDSTPLDGPMIAINSFGFGGANAHALLHSNCKTKLRGGAPQDALPRLVTWSGRTTEAVKTIFDEVARHPMDTEFLALLNNIQTEPIRKFQYRGFRVYSVNDCTFYESPIEKVTKQTQSLALIIGDVDCHWKQKIETFNEFPVFRKTIRACTDILKSKGFHLYEMSDGLVGSVTLQIGIVELFRACGIEFNNYTGTTIGQITAAYLDGCLTLEQAILTSLYHSIIQIDYRNLSSTNPSEVCRRKFLETKLHEHLSNVLPADLQPTDRWIAPTSLKMFKSFKLLESSDPTTLSLPEQAFVVDLRKLQQADQPIQAVRSFLVSLGGIFLTGRHPNLAKLYPAVDFPVSRGTPMISPLVRWDHAATWFVIKFYAQKITDSGIQAYKISLTDQDHSQLSGHCIDGRILFPATGYLLLAWETLANWKGHILEEMPVEFSDVQFIRATTLNASQAIDLTVSIQQGTGHFEIMESDVAIVTGTIRQMETTDLTTLAPPTKSAPILPMRDFYKELRLRGYHYSGVFKSVLECRMDGSYAKIAWANDWVGFLDCMLQVEIIAQDTRALAVPTGIESLCIDPILHLKRKQINEAGIEFYDVQYNPDLNVLRTGGIQVTGMQASAIARRPPPGIPVLESYQFIPYHPEAAIPAQEAARMFVQIMLENTPVASLHIVEQHSPLLQPIIALFDNAIKDLPSVKSNLVVNSAEKLSLPDCVKITNESLMNQRNLHCLIHDESYKSEPILSDVLDALMDKGYLIVRVQHGHDLAEIPPELHLISSLTIEDEVLILLRKKNGKNGPPQAIEIKSNDFEWINKLQQSKSATILYSNDQFSGILGLVNCLRREPNTQSVQCFFVNDSNAPRFSVDDTFYTAQIQLGLAINVYRNGQWGSYRHCLLENNKDPAIPVSNHCFANCLKPGDLSSFAWLNGPLNEQPVTDGRVNVVFSSLNFKDVMLSTGRLAIESSFLSRLELECVLGFEYSGVTVDGRRVMGMIPCGAMSSQVESEPYMTFDVPDVWSLEQAATIPCVYGTVYSAFFMSSQIRRGASILIHAGSGGIGLAAIETCFAYGMEVFTTVSTNAKKEFLLARFALLKPDHIGNSRDTSFERMIRTLTNGRGVDFVLNSLSEEKLQASVRCLAKGGHFLEIGKYDMTKNSKLAMELFQKGITFTAVLLDLLFSGTETQKMTLHRILADDIRRGVVKPLPTTVFEAPEIEKAFRFLAGGKHMGKVLLRIRKNEDDRCTIPIQVCPRMFCSPEATYVIVGGLGGFGLELADWLILRGCRMLVLSSSRGITQAYQEFRIRNWKSYGVEVLVSTADVTTNEGARSLLIEACTLGPVAAIFNLAVQLRDAIFENQTAQAFAECLRPKATATGWLDRWSRTLCPELQHFVVFSSVSCGRGNAGQSNYGMANSIMERIVEGRCADGLPGKAIQWGAIGEVGLVAAMAEEKIDMEIGGTLQQRISSCLGELDRLLVACGDPIVASMVVAEKNLSGAGSKTPVEAVMNIMSIRDLKSISFESTLADIGMDSLMAVEIKQVLERDFDLVLSPQELRSLTFAKLQLLAENKESGEIVEVVDDNPAGGLEMLVKNLGLEATSQQTILRLQSQSNELDYKKAILLVPGIESVAGDVWKSIASKINAPTFILQTLNNYQCQSLDTIADAVYEEVLDKVYSKVEQFTIVGYSFGVLIAIEIAKRLERDNLVGKLMLIDGAPKYLKMLANADIHKSDEDIQKSILYAIQAISQSKETLVFNRGEFTFKERIDKLLELHKDETAYSKSYIEKTIHALFYRMKMALSLNPEAYQNSLRCPVTLVKPTKAPLLDIDNDYGLTDITDSTVSTNTLEGTHQTMLQNPQLLDMINQGFL
ncbi:fatty acid synthase-like [Culex pipiens pallens]|uniref:fatty acid synthase-like n=1 Tax=Culex pipiens pallens TaxID=42434 RepID=UPI001954A167|nr:fatty acid synthase-like [Culex pipiens pallens]